METQQERLVGLLQRLELIEATYGREMPHIKREIAELIRLTRVNATGTIPAGILCAGPDVWDMVQPAEPVDSSAAIPLEEIERIERGGE